MQLNIKIPKAKASALGADGIMDEDFNHMMETTNEQFKLLKINMKELVFPHLHKPIEKINQLLIAINKNPLLQKGIFTAIIGTIGVGVVLTTLGNIIRVSVDAIEKWETRINVESVAVEINANQIKVKIQWSLKSYNTTTGSTEVNL